MLSHRTMVLGAAVLFLLNPLSSLRAEEAKPENAPPAEKVQWKTLFNGKSLDGWKPADFFKPGKLHVKDGTIVMERGRAMTGCFYAKGDFPKADYEVVFEGKKLDGDDFFCTATFPVGDSHCSFVVGGWGGSVIGLSSIDGADASENETSGNQTFKKDQWYRVRILVTRNRIQAWIDKEKHVDIDVSDRKVDIRGECRVCLPFGFCTYDTVGAIRDVRVRPLSPAEKKMLEAKKE